MSHLSNTRKPCMNTSIRLFRKNNNVLNTSRKILQKSINRSVLCANSLKSNNASLAKRLAELQVELSAQRTATLEAKTEATRLRFELVRLQAQVDSMGKLKDILINMRESVVSMCDSGMSLMRYVNEVSSLFDNAVDSDQSAMLNTNLMSDTLANLSHMFSAPEPPKTMAPVMSLSSNTTSSAMVKTATLPERMILLRRPVPIEDSQLPIPSPDLSRRIPESFMVRSVCEAPTRSASPKTSVCSNQAATVVVQLDSPLLSHAKTTPTKQSDFDPVLDKENLTDRGFSLTPNKQQSCSVVQPPSIPSSPPKRDSLLSTVASRTHLNRAARLKSKPIVDASPGLSPALTAKPPARSKRRRLCHNDDSDEDECGAGQAKPSKDKCLFKVPLSPAPRTVEVHLKRPGEVAFRADTKRAHELDPPSRSKKKSEPKSTARSKSKSPVVVVSKLPEPAKPKSVFDISANQTVNMSVLPPTLDELRKQELNKRLLVHDPSKLGSNRSNPPSVYVVSSSSDRNHASPMLCPSAQTNNPPFKNPSVNTAITVKPSNTTNNPFTVPSLSTNTRSTNRRRFRRLHLNDDDDHGTADDADKENRRSSSSTTTSSEVRKTRGRP